MIEESQEAFSVSLLIGWRVGLEIGLGWADKVIGSMESLEKAVKVCRDSASGIRY